MNKLTKVILMIVIVVAVSLTYKYLSNRNKVSDELTLYGNIEIRQVDVGFRVEGIIDKLFFEEGDNVKKGQLLATLQSRQYKSSYDKAVAEIQMNRAINKNATAKYERNRPLCSENTVSKQDCDDMMNAEKSSNAALKASIANAKYAKNNLEDASIYAPCDGIIMTRIKEPGAVSTPGGAIYTIAKNKPVWIRAYVPETDLGNIKYGMKTKVLTDSIDPKTGKNREYTGWIGYISPVAEFTPKTVETTELRTDLVYRIRVYVYEVDEYLRLGMPVTIQIDLKQKAYPAPSELRSRLDD